MHSDSRNVGLEPVTRGHERILELQGLTSRHAERRYLNRAGNLRAVIRMEFIEGLERTLGRLLHECGVAGVCGDRAWAIAAARYEQARSAELVSKQEGERSCHVQTRGCGRIGPTKIGCRIRRCKFLVEPNNIAGRPTRAVRPRNRHQLPAGVGSARAMRLGRSYQSLERLTMATTDSMTGTSTSTPTTVANAAPDSSPNRLIAVATASSKKFDAPISADGAAAQWATPSARLRK